MTRHLFGTDGIRGPAGQYLLTPEGALQVGMAIGVHFAEPGELLCVGFDTRESSHMLSSALSAGVLATGVNVEVLGVAPTPAVAYLTSRSEAKAGVVITASHNPYHDNGIKIFSGSGDKLPDDTEAKLNELIESPISPRGFGRQYDASGRTVLYEDYLASVAGAKLEGLEIALDMANGATSGFAERIFRQLGARVVPLFAQPDGRNINDDCGAAAPGKLIQEVQERKLSMGAAFDGDGDRLVLVDEIGRVLDGDHILYINALMRGEHGVVATLMSNMGLETSLKENGIALHRTDVGDRYVLEGLRTTGLNLGGEQSGHIIFTDFMPTGDGMLAAIETVKNARASGLSLAQWRDTLPLLPQKLVNFAVPDKTIVNSPRVIDLVTKLTEELGTMGRVSVRASGTEQKLRVMVEAPDADVRAEGLAAQIQQLILAS